MLFMQRHHLQLLLLIAIIGCGFLNWFQGTSFFALTFKQDERSESTALGWIAFLFCFIGIYQLWKNHRVDALIRRATFWVLLFVVVKAFLGGLVTDSGYSYGLGPWIAALLATILLYLPNKEAKETKL